MACCTIPISVETPCPRMPIYGGFSLAADGIGFKMPCEWCGETIAASCLEKPVFVENGFTDSDRAALKAHLKKHHSNLFKGKTFIQSCEKCKAHAI